MFRRREDGTEELITDGAAAPETGKAASESAASTASSTSASTSQPAFRPVPPQAAMVAATRNAMSSIPSSSSSSTSESSRSAPAASSLRASSSNKRVLTVGPDIQMKGEITSCDRVVIEGVVDATMRDVHTVELTESGSLKGTAEVEDAEISGSFEGDITVRGKITIYASGRVRGNITYGEIEIQRGGQISGSIRNISDAKGVASPSHGKKAA